MPRGRKKKEVETEIKEEVKEAVAEVETAPAPKVQKVSPIEILFGNGDLNVVVKKLNEVIEEINK